MSEASSGSAIMAGNPAGDNAAATGGDGAASTTGTTGASGAASGDIGKKQEPASGNWYDSIEDTDLKGYVQNKGWKDPVELANGYKNLEKLLGGEKLPMPKGADDKEGWARVYDAMGRPKSAEEYKLPVPQGDNGEFAKQAASKFHELGISQQQAAALSEWWNAQQQAVSASQLNQSNERTVQDMQALKSEWGQAYDENINLGQRAVREFGLDQAKLEALESAWGTKGMMEFMAKIGRGLTEHGFEGGQNTQSFGMTPEAAKSQISALQADKEFIGKYLNGNTDAQAQMKRLMAIAYPDGQ